jgi:asparagine synthetase B (glutamine-hydrolysing)
MCGIAGVLERSGRPADPNVLQRMGDVIAHRGPDG